MSSSPFSFQAYCYSPRSGYVTEVTPIDGTRQCISSISSSVEGGGRSLSENVCVYSTACAEGDVVFVMSDGIVRNLDPESLKCLPLSLGLPRSKRSYFDE